MKNKKHFFLEKLFANFRYNQTIKYIPENSVVCDIGCGVHAEFLNKLTNSIKYGIGFDKNTKTYQDSNLKIQNLEIINKIPLDASTVDIITMLAVLEHLKNPEKILKECFRVLKNNGKLILTTPTLLAKPILEFLAFKLHLINVKQIKDHKNYFSLAQIKNMLIQAGFNKQNIKVKSFELGFNSLVVAKKSLH